MSNRGSSGIFLGRSRTQADRVPLCWATCPEARRAWIDAAAASESGSPGLQKQQQAGKGAATSAQNGDKSSSERRNFDRSPTNRPTNHHFSKAPHAQEAAAGPEPARRPSDTSSGLFYLGSASKLGKRPVSACFTNSPYFHIELVLTSRTLDGKCEQLFRSSGDGASPAGRRSPLGRLCPQKTRSPRRFQLLPV